MFDYHIHSNFSADCETPMEKTIEKAIEIGLKEICFTEHIDYEYPDPTIDFELNFKDYECKIREVQQQYRNKISIKKGVEIGVQPYLLDNYRSTIVEEQFDFIICSMHTVEKKALHSGNYFKVKTVDEAFLTYYEELLYCVKNYDLFNVLGHLDLVKRYTDEIPNNDFKEVISEIFKEIIPRGQGIEVNTSGYRYGLHRAMPSTDILTLYKELGGEIITLGSDSHVEATLAYEFNSSLELLESIGFSYITTFDEQKPEFHSIQQLQQTVK
ncbi:histidinol-phosphatase HisJ family protein [Ornithinibacillus sp. L9]|uniref:Histidinol-phosphatase n=1 Tax=Ornithinibacillus caprae TaxID=2678566 RepID=A0A6N8FKV6_9BACI|nr:histidinol-phosphatase HisJ family protein [Ornithinibacillus caprae]MUK89791.1 histidinol-phosphatase HisJ family protein [Ornithinibacillus caprae]